MDLTSLRAPRPTPPNLSVADKRVQSILRDLEEIKYSKPGKQFKKCESLIYYIVQSLRRAESDHLLHTSAIFALINIFRLFPQNSKDTMLSAGVAAVLHDILVSDLLTGSTRQYASELCFYLRFVYLLLYFLKLNKLLFTVRINHTHKPRRFQW